METNQNNDNKRYYKIGLTIFIVIALSILFFFFIFRIGDLFSFVKLILSILSPVIVGIFFAYILNPLVSVLEKQFVLLFNERVNNTKRIKSMSRGISIGLSLLIGILIIYILGNMIVPEIYNSIVKLVNTLPTEIAAFSESFQNFLKAEDPISQFVSKYALQLLDWIQKWLQNDLIKQTNVIAQFLTTSLKSVYSVVLNFVIGLIISIYLLTGKEKFLALIRKCIYAIFPERISTSLLSTAHKAHEIFSGFIIGKILDSCIIGVICFVGLSFLQIPYTILVSVIVGVTNIIPVFGPFIGAIPSALLILIESPIHGLYFIIFIIVLQQIDGNIIGPKILGNSTGLSSFWVIFSILLFGGLFGFIGMLLGVPTFAVIYYIIKNAVNKRLNKKGLPTSINQYMDSSHPMDHFKE